jgi:hypothetical protein
MDNLITLPKWENYCKDLCKVNDDYVIFNILNLNEANLDKFNFKQYTNKTIILLNPDCDFPPPKETNTYKCDPKYKGLQQDCSLLTYSDKIDYRIIKIIEEFNIQILCYSSSIFHKNVRVIPLGITWQVKIPDSITSINIDKEILCYANFGIPTIERWFGNPRQDAYNKIINKDFIFIENTQKDTVNRKMNNDYNNYFSKLLNSKFSICPRGCGIDSYRVYDSILCKCVPIMLKNGEYYKNFENWPILFIDDYDKLTADFLQNVNFEFDMSVIDIQTYVKI